MHPATPELRADWRRPSARQRALVIGLTLVAELLFLLMLLGLGPATWSGREASEPTLVDLIEAPPAPTPEPAPAKSAEEKAKAPRPVPPPTAPVLPPTPLAKSPFVKLTREEFAAADIGKLGSAGGQGTAGGGETSASVGTGPGGATLYRAEWYREPTDAELAYYLPKQIEPGAWAEVACKTIPDNRVENCQAIGESPPGSGLGRALRLAGWQFRIRPPRIDGKPQVGTWVKVHIDFTR